MRNPLPLLVVIAGAVPLLLAAVAIWVWEAIAPEPDPDTLPSRVLGPERRRPAGSARGRVVPVRRGGDVGHPGVIFRRSAREGVMRAARNETRIFCARAD